MADVISRRKENKDVFMYNIKYYVVSSYSNEKVYLYLIIPLEGRHAREHKL